MIQRLVRSVVGGSVSKWSVVGWSVSWWSVDLIKPREKHAWGVISPMHFGQGLFCYSNFNFYILTINKKEILSPEAVTQIFNYF